MDFDLNSILELVSGENEPLVHHLLVDDEDKSETYFPINPTDTRMEIPTINLDDTFDYENMYTAGDAGSLQAHNVANDKMIFRAHTSAVPHLDFQLRGGSKGSLQQVMASDFVGQVSDIPEHYILPRWTMVKEPELPPVTSIGEQMQLPPESLKLIRYTNLCTKFTQIAKDASSNEKAYRMALQRMSSMTDDLAAMKQSRKKQKKAQPAPADPARGVSDIPSASTNPTLQINDPPPIIRKQGRPVSTRRKPRVHAKASKTSVRKGLASTGK
uniref:Uncharacterized protein n=1 Tax=Oryza barthii TaxID=65489 RepID=A0A0D3GEW3_9ORYZ